ncbi:MAG TPA: cysteine synthase family protein [Candidatus Eisenbacteria bacterium]
MRLIDDLARHEPRLARHAHELLAQVGSTPLLRLNRVTRDLPADVQVFGKAEWFNPGGSVKDRPALRIVLEALRVGRLKPDGTLLDATSGNTGIGYAMVGAVLGIRVTLCLPARVSPERLATLRAYGAELVLTDPLEGTDGAIREAARLSRAEPGRFFLADQYTNPANWRAHLDTTGREIWEQTAGRVTHFVAALGTSGTFMGVGRRLKREGPDVHLTSFQPDSPFHGLDGVKHMPSAIVPGIFDPTLADRNEEVGTEEAYAMTRRLAREEGLRVGPSSGAAVVVALRVARRLSRGTVVTVFPDGGDRYLGERFWTEEDES